MSTYVLCSRVTYAHLCTISLLLFVYIAPSKVSIPGGCQPLPGDGGDHGGDELQDEGAHQEAAKGTEGAGREEGGGGGTLDQHFPFSIISIINSAQEVDSSVTMEGRVINARLPRGVVEV